MRGTSDPGAAEARDGAATRATGVRAALVAAGVLLLAGGVVLAVLRERVDGGAVLAATLGVEGAALVVLGLRPRALARWPVGARLGPARTPPGGRLPARTIVALLTLATAVAIAVRLVGIDGDLWLDEIVTVRDYASRSVGTILTRYDGPNNHLLNSLLTHGAIGAFGYAEWAIRLPALVAGVATIPAFFWVARPLLGDVRAVAATLLLAVAYPHVTFSDNARGYTASLLFGLVATGALVRGLREDRARWWLAYVAASVLCVAAVPTGAFVVVGHALVFAAVIAAASRARIGARSLVARFAVVFGAVVALCLQVYAPVLGEIGPAAERAWNEPGAGSSVFSADFLRGLVDDASAGVTPVALAALALALVVGVLGARSLLRRDWALVTALALGPLLHATVVAIRGLAFSPRFLLFLVFPIILVAVESVAVVAAWLARRLALTPANRRRLEVTGLVLAAAALVLPLVRTAGLDKQPYREALAYARSLRPDGLVVGVYHAGTGVLYYGVEHPAGDALVPEETVHIVRSLDDLERARRSPREPVVVTSQESLLRAAEPALLERIERDFVPQRTFPAAIGGGDITVWLPRP